MKKRFTVGSAVAVILIALCLAPFLYVFLKSLLTDDGATFLYYYDVLLATPQYLLRFWLSAGLAILVAVGQTIVSSLAGFGFAKYKFPGRNAVFFFLMVLMILPLQVTLVPNYIVLDKLKLLDTYGALILPAIFIPLGTFIMTQGFRAIPNEIIDAAKVDGCRTLPLFVRVALPINKNGLVCTFLLSFLDAWNMVEQPIAFIKDQERWPLSVSLASTLPADPTVRLVCCVLAVVPPLFLFMYFNRELTEGIALGKEL